jgi:hypothetical protein
VLAEGGDGKLDFHFCTQRCAILKVGAGVQRALFL